MCHLYYVVRSTHHTGNSNSQEVTSSINISNPIFTINTGHPLVCFLVMETAKKTLATPGILPSHLV
jgi:hypothetical protein